jgi:hypothetical protein
MSATIGTIVYYKATDRDTEPKPAMILAFDGNMADLDVFGAGVISYVRNAKMALNFTEAKGGEWAYTE